MHAAPIPPRERTTVVICTRNRAASLLACAASLARQTRPADELIVVDGGTLPLPAAIRRRLRRLLRPIPVRILVSPPGLPRQRNRGAEVASGSVVVFLDDDVVLEPGYLAAVAAVYEADPERTIGGVGGAQVPDPTPRERAWRRAASALFLLESHGDGRLKRSGHPRYCLSPAERRDVEFLSGCNMSFRRDVLAEMEFDERLSGYALGEDLDFSYRASRRWRLVVTPDARLDHRHARDGRPEKPELRAMFLFNKFLFVRDHVAHGAFDWAAYAWASAGDFLLQLRHPGSPRLRGTLAGYAAIARHVASGALPAVPEAPPVLPAPASGWPVVTVLVPARNEARTIGACLDSILAQRYPAARLEVVVVENGSHDATAEVAAAHARRDPRVRVLRSAATNHAEALNDGIRAARGAVVARVDAHSRIAPDYVRRAVVALRRHPDAAGVGGPFQPAGTSRFERAAGLARSSPFGVGGGYGTDRERRAHPVRSVQCGAYWRDALEAVGEFDPAMAYGEDEELNWRIVRAGWRVWLCPELEQPYRPRATPGALLRQYWHYGRGRARVLRKHPDFLQPRHLVPSGLVGVLGATGALAATGAGVAPLGAVGAAYAAVLTAAAVRAARSAPAADAALVPVAVACLHLGYGAGMLWEAARGAVARHRPTLGRRIT